MTISSTQFIIKLDRSGVTPVEDEEFDITFPYADASEILVWTIEDDIYVRKRIGTDYYLLFDKIVWNGMAPSEDMRIQRYVKYDQPNTYKTTEPKSLEKGMDDLCLRGQQQLQIDALQPQHFDAENDTISNVGRDTDESSPRNQAITKEEVDDTLNDTSGTNTFFIGDSGDVDKYLKTNTPPADPTWETVDGAPDPKGQEGKYLTEGGWETFGVIPDASADAQKLLKDVDGTPTWTEVNEFPADDAKYGRILSRDVDPIGPTDYSKWRNSGQLPSPLGQHQWHNVQKTDDNTRYQWKDRLFTTSHGVAATKVPGIDDGVTDANHWIFHGTIDNVYNEVPSYLYVQRIDKGAGNGTFPRGNHPFYQWMHFGAYGGYWDYPIQYTIYLPFVANIESVSATNISINFGCPIHWRFFGYRTESPTVRYSGNYAMSDIDHHISLDVDLMWYFSEDDK